MASQTFPFPGKRGLRGEIAQADARRRFLDAERVRLTTVADVRRAYLALQLARERLALLEKLGALWETSVGVAQSRYEAGEGPQSDVLRARLELARLGQRRRLLEVGERVPLQSLNRLRKKPLDERIETSPRLTELGFPQPPAEQAALAGAREHSPELLASHAGIDRAARTKELAQRSYFPDLSVGAGVMVRGSLDPMWTLTLGVPLPVFAGARQSRGVAEATALTQAAGYDLETVEQLLALRTHQRLDLWRALGEVWQSYQQGVLVLAEATAQSTLAHYRVGKVSFASVLEANSSAIAEADAALAVLAEAWSLAIASDEVSLAEVGAEPAPMASSSVPGAGASPDPGASSTGM